MKSVFFLGFCVLCLFACGENSDLARVTSSIAKQLCLLRTTKNDTLRSGHIIRTINADTKVFISTPLKGKREDEATEKEREEMLMLAYELMGTAEREAKECGCTQEYVRNFFSTEGLMGIKFREVLKQLDTLEPMVFVSNARYGYKGETFIRQKADTTIYWNLLRDDDENVVYLKKTTFAHDRVSFCAPQKDSIDQPHISKTPSSYDGEHYQFKICPLDKSTICEETFNARLTLRVVCDSEITLSFNTFEKAEKALLRIKEKQGKLADVQHR